MWTAGERREPAPGEATASEPDATVGSSSRAESLLQAILESCDDAIVTCDSRWRLTSWGATAARLFGRSADQSLGERLDALFAEDLRGEVLAVMDRVSGGEQILHFESEAWRGDGLPMPVSLSISPLVALGETGEAGGTGGASTTSGAVVIVRDVTEQVLAQAVLAEVQARLDESEARAHIGSWLWDRRTGAVQWSAEFHRLHDVDPIEFGGNLESFLAAVHPQDRDRLQNSLQASAASATTVELDYRLAPASEGTPAAEKVVRVRAQPTLGSGDAVVGLRGTGVLVGPAAPE